MQQLTNLEIMEISGGFKFHFNVFQAIFVVVGATIGGGPAMGGIALAGLVATQGAGNLGEMYNNLGVTPQYSFGKPYNTVYQW